MDNLGFTCTGGVNSPYIWVYTGTDSWSFFERILKDAEVVLTPGNGFGKCGEGYVRISAFNHQEKVEEAMERVKTALNS